MGVTTDRLPASTTDGRGRPCDDGILMNKSKVYSSDFYTYNRRVAMASARIVIPPVAAALGPASVLDVGCGAGAWCRVWKENGAEVVLGTDGSYVDRAQLLVDPDSFVAADLAQPFDLGRRFDLVMSLEVAEHVHEIHADTFVDNLTRHGDVVLFSAAVPGQGGEFHVNEQPLEYWRSKFLARGYQCFDPFRPMFRDNGAVAPWYRFNTLLYVADAAVEGLSPALQASKVPQGEPLGADSPLWWRLRNGTLGLLPHRVTDALARARSSWVRMRHARS